MPIPQRKRPLRARTLKLLLDQNLSPRLVTALADLYPRSAHVRDFGLETADDESVWNQAAAAGYVIVTKDGDYRQQSFFRGPPPKVIWIRLGNCRTAEIEAILRTRHADVIAFEENAQAALLVLSRLV